MYHVHVYEKLEVDLYLIFKLSECLIDGAAGYRIFMEFAQQTKTTAKERLAT